MRMEADLTLTSYNWRFEKIKNFLNSGFGKVQNENLYICITHAGRNYLNGSNGDFKDSFFPCNCSGIKKASNHILSIDKEREIYFRCAVLSKQNRNKESAEILPFIYADIDFKENHQESQKNYPTVKEVFTMFSGGLIPKPSRVIYTGNGYHCYWILKKPVKARDYPEIVSNWQQKIRSVLKRDIDPTGDFARILRIPCTFNNKTKKQKHVAITTRGSDEFYDLDELIEPYGSEKTSTHTDTRGKVLSQENNVVATEKKCKNSKERFIEKNDKYSKDEKQHLNRWTKKSVKFRYLKEGNWKIYGDEYKSQSEADFNFIKMLAKIFNKNPEKMKACFLQSGLNDADRIKKKGGVFNYYKYVDRTIRKALKFAPKEPPAKPKRGKKNGNYDFERLHGKALIKHGGSVRVYKALIKLERKWGKDNGGKLFASYDNIVEESGVSKSSVKNHLIFLQGLGLIHSLITGKSNSREKKATELNRTIPIPTKLQTLA